MSKEKVKLFGNDFSLSTQKHNYLHVTYQFECIANKAYSQYTNDFNKYSNNLKDIISNAAEHIKKAYKMSSDKILEMLAENDIYNISANDIQKEFINCGEAIEAYNTIEDKYEEIITDQAEKDAYRTARRQNRSKWEGGGFGLSGAIKGAATAGALNMASGAAHGAFNLIAKAGSSISAAIDKSSIYEEEKKEQSIALGIWLDIYSARMFYMNALQNAKKCNFEIITDDDEDEAETLFGNCTTVVSNPEKQKELLFKVLLLDGTVKKYYSYILKTFPEEAASIITIAGWYHVDIDNYLNELMNHYLKEYLESNSNLKTVKNDLCDKMKEIGLSKCDALNTINNMIDDELMQNITKDYQTSNLNNCRIILEKAQTANAQDSIKEKYINDVNARILSLERDILNNISKNYESLNTEQCETIIENIKQADVHEELKIEYTNNVTKRINDIFANEDSNTFNSILLRTDFNNPNSIQQSKNLINSSAKTDVKSAYLNALDGINSQTVKNAQKYYKYKQKGFIKYHMIKLIILLLLVLPMGIIPEEYSDTVASILSLPFLVIVGSMIYTSTTCKKAFNLLTVNSSAINNIIKAHTN